MDVCHGVAESVVEQPSQATVRVRIIDTTSQIKNLPAAAFLSPIFPGLETLAGPCYSFLIEHPKRKSLIYDLGVRKDWQNLAPAIVDRIQTIGCEIQVDIGVREQLDLHGVDTSGVEAVIWSHWHWDHTGDPSTFEASTALIVGPGFKENFLPGYPADPNGRILQSDYQGRELKEIKFDQNLTIGGFDAVDYYGDGSFFILDSPGHALGHICGLARVTANPSSFILMGGDICHHAGQFRPSIGLPLPEAIIPNPLTELGISRCPGSMFEHLLPGQERNKSFYTIARAKDGLRVAHDPDAAQDSIRKLQNCDASDKVFIIIAHDNSIRHIVDFFPMYADEFLEKRWALTSKWMFLKDFSQALKL